MNCGNQASENGSKKKEKRIVVVKIQGGIFLEKKVLRSQYFYNIFTINHRLLLIVIGLNLNLTLRLLF